MAAYAARANIIIYIMIDDRTIDRIRSVASIVDVVGDFIELRRSGSELTAPCPLHGGQHLGHFKVNIRKNMYYCFVCGEGGGPVDFLMAYKGLTYPDALRWLGRKYSIQVDEEQKAERFDKVKPSEPKKIELPPELPTLTLPLDLVKSRRDTREDNFCQWVRQLPWNSEQAARVEKVLEAYAVGHSGRGETNGMTIFWQIDHEGKVHTGKMMRYYPEGHPNFGKRDKDGKYTKDWVHSIIARGKHYEVYNPEEQQMRPCLFGLHLVHAKGIREWDVNIVESEKTAIVMAIAQGGSKGLWMATGGLQFLKRETLQPLFDLGLNIVLHPDHDGDAKWRKKMADFGYKYGDDYQVNNFYVNVAWKEEDGDKADCADIVVRQLYDAKRKKTVNSLGEIIGRNENLKLLINTFDLELERHEGNGKTG